MSAQNDESKWSFCNLNGKGVLPVAHCCHSSGNVWFVAITSTWHAVLFGLNLLPGSLEKSPHEKSARCQSNSTTCADIKHYCKLTFHMDCNSAFLKIATKSLKRLFVFALWGLIWPSPVTSFHSVSEDILEMIFNASLKAFQRKG